MLQIGQRQDDQMSRFNSFKSVTQVSITITNFIRPKRLLFSMGF